VTKMWDANATLCGNCEHWCSDSVDANGAPNGRAYHLLYSDGSVLSPCRAKAPVAHRALGHGILEFTSDWPITHRTDKCGESQPREGESDGPR